MIVSLIAAISKNRVLGRNNHLIWNIPPDLLHFKEKTMNHHILMGRKTYETLPAELPGRILLVLSKNSKNNNENTYWFHSVLNAIDFAKNRGEEELFVIGGGAIFQETMPWAEKMYLTEIEAIAEGDIFFPEIDYRVWQMKKTSEKKEYNGLNYSFKEYQRKIWRKTRTHEDG
jgi:dihydrofolate reductase